MHLIILQPITTVIDKQDSKNGLTMTVKEAAYDGSRLIVTVVYTGEKELSMKEEIVGFNYITINGQPVKPAMGSTGQDDLNSKTIIEHHQYTFSNYNEYGDKIEIAVHGEDLFGYKGKLKVVVDDNGHVYYQLKLQAGMVGNYGHIGY
ncbi:DUF4179 domain-containing protein [Gottfriedia acidiceleris]|uniref:DUF4179 domain-containing protein n=1 Tax=Gottfriedia acidiceleris TaxID=371036 RepID=UPI002F260F57